MLYVRTGVTNCLETLARMHRRLPKRQGNLKVRVFNSQASVSVYRADRRYLVSVFLHGQLAIHSPQFEIEGTEDTVLGEQPRGDPAIARDAGAVAVWIRWAGGEVTPPPCIRLIDLTTSTRHLRHVIASPAAPCRFKRAVVEISEYPEFEASRASVKGRGQRNTDQLRYQVAKRLNHRLTKRASSKGGRSSRGRGCGGSQAAERGAVAHRHCHVRQKGALRGYVDSDRGQRHTRPSARLRRRHGSGKCGSTPVFADVEVHRAASALKRKIQQPIYSIVAALRP
jgi:hypothetical protein